MSQIALDQDSRLRLAMHPGWVVAALTLVAATLSCIQLSAQLPPRLWLSAALGADGSDLSEWIVHYSYMPRLCVSIIAGAALALAAAIFQQVLRNPLAEPTTLGVSAGASIAVTAATLWFPDLFSFGRESVAIAGAAIATLLVFGLAWGKGLSPLSLIVAGLIVGLYLGAVSAVVALFNHQMLQSVFLWSSGVLRQNDWSAVVYLFPRFLVGLACAFVIVRPLAVLSLDDESGKNLGMSLHTTRLFALSIAVSLSGFVVSAVGTIGFVGLAAPAIARLSGARTVRQQLVWAPMVGGSLLWLTDQFVQILPLGQELPTGVGTAILGAPILMWMLPRLRGATIPPKANAAEIILRTRNPWAIVLFILAALVIILWPLLSFGQGPHGWQWLPYDELQRLMHWRWPRMTAAMAAGAMLAIAGTLMQRLTGNAMASPEVLGISSGAACGVIILAFLVHSPDKAMQIGAAAVGALATLVAMLAVGRQASFSPERMLLVGIAIGTVFGALVALLMSSGDPRMGALMSWMAGSTYQVLEPDALLAVAILIALLPTMPLLTRWLDILPLGEEPSRSLGVDLRTSRFRILLLTAALTGTATLIVGPLSFVGLMAPHMTRMLGLQRPMAHLYGSAAVGALIMLLADWFGRNLLFPYQIPAGLLGTFIGGPYFMWLMWKAGK